jgi:hypothetical protein
MRIITLILLPWIVYGILSICNWWNAGINIGIAFTIEAVYFCILYAIDVLYCYNEPEPETAMERARRVVG